MKKYLLIVSFLSVGLGQGKDNQETPFVNESTFKSPKLYCSECQLSMRETITRYVCRDDHMSVKKSNVKIDKSGKLYVVKDGAFEGEYEGGIKLGAVLVAASGALGLYMNNLEFDSVDEWYDYIESDAKALNNARFGLLLIGGILLLFD